MAKIGDDCYFFYYSNCSKGAACPFRHCPEALGNEIVCTLWKEGRCFRAKCIYRHMEIVKNRQTIDCYWESQPNGCQKAHCAFKHTKPRIINGRQLEPDAAPQAAGAQGVQATGDLRDAPGKSSPPPPPSIPAPKVQKVVINFDEESDADSIQGTPVKKSPVKLQEIKVPDKPKFISTRKGTDDTEEEVDFDIKSLEELRREKVRLARKLLEDAENELLASGAPIDTPPTAPPQPKVRTRMSPPKKITLGKSGSSDNIPIKSLEEIRREQALATLKRGAKRNSDERSFVSGESSQPEEPPAKKATHAKEAEKTENDGSDLKIKSLEEIRREQALASMRKRIAEKERAKKEAEREMGTVTRTHSTSSIEDDIPAPTSVTRRVVIASEDEPAKPKPAPKVSLDKRLGHRNIITEKKAKAEISVKSRLGPHGGIKKRLGLTTQALRQNREKAESEERSEQGSTGSVSSSEIFSDDEIEVRKKPEEPKEREIKKKVLEASEPVIRRKITLGNSSSGDAKALTSLKRVADGKPEDGSDSKKVRKAKVVQLYKPPAWKDREQKSLTTSKTTSEDSSSRPAKGGRKAIGWGAKSYSEMVREKQLAKASPSKASTDEPSEEKPKRFSPIVFDEAAKIRETRGISPIRVDKAKSACSSPDVKRRSPSPVVRFVHPSKSRSISPVRSTKPTKISRVNSPMKSDDRDSRKDSQPIRRKGPKLVWSTRADQPRRDIKINRLAKSDEHTSKESRINRSTKSEERQTKDIKINRVRKSEEPTVKPTRKLTLNTKKLTDEPKPSPMRPAFMRAVPKEEETSVSSPIESKKDTEKPSFTTPSVPKPEKVKSPEIKSPPVKSSIQPPTLKSPPVKETPKTRRSSRGSVSSNKDEKKAGSLDDLGHEMDLLDDDLIDLFTDDGEAQPITSTETNADELLAQMDEFLGD